MCEYVYLVPGNWFELKNINKNKVIPYDIESLKQEILNQVFNRSENLQIINVTYGKPYHNINNEDITLYLDKEKFQNIGELLSHETRHPIMTFHGTNNLETVKSIFSSGYLIPGKNGIKIKHGSAYGKGIYSSPFFDKALAYTHPDKNQSVYVLINILFLGKAKMISPQVSGYKKEDNTIHTKIVFGLDQLISLDESRVIPVGVIK
jgi:hypothetical protein